jgi:type IV pilus assembly protein PilM
MNKIGIDIGTSKIKAVEISEQAGLPRLVSFDISNFPQIPFFSESSSDIGQLKNFLKDYIFSQKFTTNNIIFSIPESKVFTKIIEIPNIFGKELLESVKWEAQQYFPDSLDDLSIHYQVLPSQKPVNSKEQKREVFLVAVSKSMVERFVSFFDQIGASVRGIEPASMSICRMLKSDQGSAVSLALNIGSDSSDIIISQDDIIRFTRTISTGTGALCRVIAQEIGIDEKRAESYLESYGLDETKLEGKIAKALLPIYEIILTEVKRSIAFYESKKQEDKIGRIVLCGGGAVIPGSLSYLASQSGIEAEVSNPWRNFDLGNYSSRINDLDTLGPLFTTACGLALKPI